MAGRCQLYLVTPPAFVATDFTADLKRALEGGPIAALQLRLKGASDEAVLAAGAALKPLCADAGIALIVNDRADLAQAIGADGVHLGQQDGSVSAARQLLGADAQIGVTCHDSRHLAMEAGEAGADYVAFGAFFPSTTKEPPAMADVELLAWWAGMMEVPCVAIGGITPENAPPLIASGADFLAVSNGVWQHSEGPAAAVRRFHALFANA